jgi:hypothetical protein
MVDIAERSGESWEGLRGLEELEAFFLTTGLLEGSESSEASESVKALGRLPVVAWTGRKGGKRALNSNLLHRCKIGPK